MQVHRQSRQRARTRLLVLLGLVLVAGISFAGAYFWQPRLVQDFIAPAIAPAPVQEGRTVRLADVDTDMDTDIDTPQQPELPAPPPPPDFTPGEFAVPWQVEASEPVELSYFYDAIFFGDSLLAGFVTHRLTPGAAVLTAIGATPGSALESPLIPTADGPATMLEAAREKGDRERVYIMLGSQSLGMDADEFAAGYALFVNAVRYQYPEAVIYIMSLPPVAAHVGEFHPQASRERVLELNAAIAEFARVNGLPFLNVFDALAGDDGYLPAHASSDGLHLSAEYYFILLDFLKAHTVS